LGLISPTSAVRFRLPLLRFKELEILVPAKLLCCPTTVAVGAPDVALSDFVLDATQSPVAVNHLTNRKDFFFIVTMVKVQNDRVPFAAVHARMVFEVIEYPFKLASAVTTCVNVTFPLVASPLVRQVTGFAPRVDAARHDVEVTFGLVALTLGASAEYCL